MARASVSSVFVLVVCLLFPRWVLAAAVPPPEVRHPGKPHICDSGPKRGCACNSDPNGDPNGGCSDHPVDPLPVLEGGPQCVPLVLPAPRGSGTLTFIIDEDVTDYDRPDAPQTNRAFTVLFEVKAPDGRHLLADIYQNLGDPTGDPGGMWSDGFEFGPVDEFSTALFFGDPEENGIEGFLRDF